MRVLCLITDAYGGEGGIALYNRDLVRALCERADSTQVVAIPRVIAHQPQPGDFPGGLTWREGASGSKLKYGVAVIAELLARADFDLIVCGHLHLLPMAWLVKAITRAPILQYLHGLEAWATTRHVLANALAGHVDAVASVSQVTLQRFSAWARPRRHVRQFVLPNAIHADCYAPGDKAPHLLGRYGLEGKKVLMTLGRMARGESKGFDRVLEAMPDLFNHVPSAVYLAVGDGTDRARLEQKASALGLSARVVFTGKVPESEKADHYRLADAYVMPSLGEGFGFVFLEALACGIPVVASSQDGGREATADGRMGILVNPASRPELVNGILACLQRPRGGVPSELAYFSFESFKQRLDLALHQIRES